MELAEVKQFLGLPDDVDSLDKFKEHFNTTYVNKDKAHLDETIKSKATGDVLRRISSKVANELSDYGIKTTDFEEKPFEDVIKIAAGNIKTKITELSEMGGKPDARIKTLEDDLTKLKTEKEQIKLQWETTANEFNTFKQEKDNEIKTWKINNIVKDAKSKIPFVDGMTEIQRTGFETVVNTNYVFDLDGDNVVVKDTKGNFVPSKQKAGQFASVEEVLDMVADSNGLKKKNNAKSQTVMQVQTTEQTVAPRTSIYKRN